MKPMFERALALRHSRNATERKSIPFGTLLADGSPMLVHEHSLAEHLYIRGAPGSGKSAVLAYLIELILSLGLCRMSLFDMKKNGTRELFAAAEAGAKRSGMRVLWFVDCEGRSTHTLNIFQQKFWRSYSPMDRADFVTTVLGSSHGLVDYGKQHYGSIAVRICLEVFRRWDVESWRDLEVRIDTVLKSAKFCGLDKNMVQGATQLRNDVNRMAQIAPLNHPTSSIDLCSKEPQVIYWSFPRKFAMAGAIARMAIQGEFAASDIDPDLRRWLVIDEFQRVVGNNIEMLFTQSRESLGLILANQSLADLRTRERDYGPIVKTCCRLHWTFNAADEEEQLFMTEVSGKVTRKTKTTTHIKPFIGSTTIQTSYQEVETNRYGFNEISIACSRPELSIFRCTQDYGFLQYGGFPQVLYTEFHISREEHDRRKLLPWPGPEDGTIDGELPPLLGPPTPAGPKLLNPPTIVNPGKPPRRAPKNPLP